MTNLPVIGVECSPDVLSLVWERTLSYYDGPLIAVFNGNGQKYLLTWVDFDTKYNRWLCTPTDEATIARYAEGSLPLLDAIDPLNKPTVHLGDVDGDGKFQRLYALSGSEIPPNYLPLPGSTLQSAPPENS